MNHIIPCQPTSEGKKTIHHNILVTLQLHTIETYAYDRAPIHRHTNQMCVNKVMWERKKKLEEKTATAMHMHTIWSMNASMYIFYRYISVFFFCSSFYGSRLSFYRFKGGCLNLIKMFLSRRYSTRMEMKVPVLISTIYYSNWNYWPRKSLTPKSEFKQCTLFSHEFVWMVVLWFCYCFDCYVA